MKNIVSTICLFILTPVLVYADGPSIPKGYRMPNEKELASSIRNTDKHRYSSVAGDFNGDGLIDGAFLLIDSANKDLAVFVFLCTDRDQSFKWYKVRSFEYDAIKYTGLRLLHPQKIFHYSDIREKTKTELKLVHDSFELFQFEGSSSVFYYEKGSDKFKQVWISK